jgi:hypothetical protein
MARRAAAMRKPDDIRASRASAVMVGTVFSLMLVFAVGKITRAAVRTDDRYAVSFADIDCTLPPGQERETFLAEVQYLAGMPDRLSIVDENLAVSLADAFARHPLVETVEHVVIQPARQVHVRLDFRVRPKTGEIARR